MLVTAALLCGSALVGSVALTSAATAAAPVVNLGGRVSDPGFRGVVTSHSQQLGIARLRNGVYGVCFDTGVDHPWPSVTPASSLRTHPRVAYLLATYLPRAKGDGRYAAALWWATGLDLGVNRYPGAMRSALRQLRADSARTYAAVRSLHDRMLTEAATSAPGAGGYDTSRLTAASTGPAVQAGRPVGAGRVGGIGVRSAAGRWLPGYPVTVTLSGATWRGGTSRRWTGTTGRAPISLTYLQSAATAVTVAMSVGRLPSARYRLHDAHDRTQRVGVSAGAVSASRTVRTGAPVGHARARKVDAVSGTPLAGAGFEAWVDADRDGTADAAESPRSLTSAADGLTALVSTFRGARVCFRETRAPVDHLLNPRTACVAAGGTAAAPATVVVKDDRRWRPTLATRVNHQTATAGAVLVDRVTVTGTGGARLTGSWRLLGPLAARSGSCRGLSWSAAPLAAAGSFTVGGDGTVTVGSFRVSKPGCYTYSEALEASPTTSPTGWTAPGIPTETAAVRPRPAPVPRHPQVTSGGEGRLPAPLGRRGTPARVRVPAVGLATTLGTTRFHRSRMSPPADIRTGGLWADGAALDAAAGTSVLVGHVSDDHDRPGAFKRLWRVRRGALVTTRDHGATSTWRVVSVRRFDRDRLPRRLFRQSLERRLVLITCADRVTRGGYFHYAANEVVVAVPTGR